VRKLTVLENLFVETLQDKEYWSQTCNVFF